MNTTQNIVKQAATRDINLAKKHGIVCVCETSIGNIEVSFNGQAFTMHNFNTGEAIAASLTKEQAIEKLSSYYVVVTE